MALAAQERLSQGGQNAAKVRLAGLGDAVDIMRLLSETNVAVTTAKEVEENLEQGGALLLESKAGTLLCALVWLEAEHGWTLRQPAVLEAYRDQELDRWVLTKLEALAIQRNIPTLKMRLDDESRLSYYARMGYRLEGDDTLLLSKRVGGTWQYK